MKTAEMKACPLCGKECAVRGGGLTHHIKWHTRQGDLSKDCNIGEGGVIMNTAEAEGDYLDRAFLRFASTGTCAIQLDHPLIMPRRRIAKRILFLTHGALFGDPRGVIVGMAGGGCEVLRLNKPSKTQLMRVGLPSALADVVLAKLKGLTE